MKAKELRSLAVEDLKSKIIELRKELIKHNGQIATGTSPKSPGQVKEMRKTIARILTIITERKNESKDKVQKEQTKTQKPSSKSKKESEKPKVSKKKTEEEL